MPAYEPTDDGTVRGNERASGDTAESTNGNERTPQDRIPPGVLRNVRNGTFALLAGGVMLGRALRAVATSRGRAAFTALVGVGLIVLGIRQRRTMDAESKEYPYSTGEREKRHRETDVTFTEEPDDDRPKPDLDADTGDPRRRTDEEQVEIDISESELADEPGEAISPDPEHAQPTQTDELEPETSPTGDGADAVEDTTGEGGEEKEGMEETGTEGTGIDESGANGDEETMGSEQTGNDTSEGEGDDSDNSEGESDESSSDDSRG